jgi:carbamoyltransferase
MTFLVIFDICHTMKILGISAFYHDSAACLIDDGKIIAACEEERFSRVKHDNNFPFNAVKKCLQMAKVNIEAIDYVAYYEKPLLKFERILQTFVETWPRSIFPFIQAMPEWLGAKLKPESCLRKLGYRGKIFYIPHHLSHAAVSYYSSPFAKAAILTIDGVGEWQTTILYQAEGLKITPLKTINFPHSLGLLYSTFTSFLGFKVNDDEFKVMGLAAYGKPIYKEKIYRVIDIKKDGSFRLNLDHFSFRESFSMYSKKFEKLFGKPRKSDQPVTQYHKDLAKSLQAVTEEIYFNILNYLYSMTKNTNLCISGGVALNAVANGKIFANTPFKNIYIFGPASDGGSALGSALFLYHYLFEKKREKPVASLSLGTFYSDNQIEKELKKFNLKYQKFSNKKELVKKTAKLLAEGKIIGWFQGRMEFGPRALGNRSILCRPYPRIMKTKVNQIKKREQFRPFAASVLEEKADEYFELPKNNRHFPFMNFCFPVKNEKKEKIAAIVHADGTCRIQTVDKSNNLYYALIKEFYRLTGVACILNTSFNLKGEPIVENPAQAIEDFLKTKMDCLVIGSFLMEKS